MSTIWIAFVALLTLTAAASDDTWQPKSAEEIRQIRTDCIREHPLTDDVIAQMKQFDFPDEESVRQYLLCTSLKLHIFCEDKGYFAERLAKQFKMDLNEAEVLAITTGCIDDNKAQKSTTDVWAFRGHQCLMRSKVGDRVRAYIKRREQQAAAAAANATGHGA